MPFINRKRELALLDQSFLDQRSGKLFVLYGRRRVGKTALLRHWVGLHQHRALYWSADRTTVANQIRTFSQALDQFVSPEIPVDPNFSYLTWDKIFDRLAEVTRHSNQRLVVVLDEFTYLIESDPALPSVLQRKWDLQLKDTNLMLVLTGSHAGMIEREVLAYRSPLYNRATHSLHLQGLPFGCLKEFFPTYNAEARVSLYGILGGIPQYFELLQPQLSWEDNLRGLLSSSMMLDDAGALLRDQLSEPRNYVAIVQSIAAGFNRTMDIATMSGLPSTHVSKYLSVLQHLDIVARDVPATVSRPDQSKQGRYRLTDPYLRFYYRFLAPARSALDQGYYNQVWDNIQQHLSEFTGTHVFELLCREWVMQMGDAGKLPFVPRRVGSFWAHRGPQVDVVAINEDAHTLLLGECKWTQDKIGRSVVEGLIEKTARVAPAANTPWRVIYAFFSKTGFKDEAYAAAQTAHAECLWVDLKQLDQDLKG